MSEDPKMLAPKYQDLYSGYYSQAPTAMHCKREISAASSASCIARAIGDGRPLSLLDVGAGDGNVLAQLDARELVPELYAVEISASGIEAIRARGLQRLREAQLFDGYKIPYPDKHFDLAIAVHVLEHVEHERLFLREIRRISRFAYIEVPLEHVLRIQRSIDSGKKYGHINFYTRETLNSLLDSSGFKVLGCEVVPSSLAYEQQISGKVRGLLKNVVRTAALAAAPMIASRLFVYNAYAYCDCA
jgi:Methyltransferase domain